MFIYVNHVLHPVARARMRAGLGAHASAPTHAVALRRRRLWVARLAGVRIGAGVQRGHQRVEHRVCDEHGLCMRRPRRPADPGGTPPRRDALGRSSMRRGPLCTAGTPTRMRACLRRRVGTRMRRFSVGIAARTKDGIYVCMFMYVCIHIYVCIIHVCILVCMCLCERWDGRACGCTASHADVRAIARADDAAVAITCARGYVRQDI
jgi:hypothetical protein